jgi:predicted nucleic acid-binding Zn ribbon protein
MSNEVKCPKCSSTQLTAHKKGFSGKKAVAGAVLTGGVGLLAGTIGSNKIQITCLGCGHTFKPGQPKKELSEEQKEKNRKINKVLIPIVFGIIILLIVLAMI